MFILRLCHRKNNPASPKNSDKRSVLIPLRQEHNSPVTLRKLQKVRKNRSVHNSTLRKMKKIVTLLLIGFSITTQSLNAQLDLAFVSNFSGNSANSCNRLSWTIASNQSISGFEVEKSTNGKDFKTIAVLGATEKFNTENYTYADTAISADKIMYRLRVLIRRSQNDFYSRIILVQSKIKLDDNVRIIGNPVSDKLSFNYNSTEVQQAAIKIYSLTGKILIDQKINSFKGNNLITLPLSSGFSPGIYVLEINTDISNQTLKFVKQ